MAKAKARNKFSERVPRVVITGEYPGRTQTQFQKQCDINHIVAKAKLQGTISHVAKVRDVYGDFSQYVDTAEAYDRVAKAQQAFEQLPSAIRMEFHNDPTNMLKFVDLANTDSEEGKEALKKGIKMGIFNPPKPAEPEKIVKVQITNPDKAEA